MKLRKYNSQELRSAVARSQSMRQTLIALGAAPYGGNDEVLRRAIRHFRLDTSHFTGQASNRNRKFRPRRRLTEYLANEAPIQSHKLRKRLLRENVLAHRCQSCGRTEWNGLPIPLELDHINGDNLDNSLQNLRLLRPNCHAQTPTYRGRGRSRA